VLLHFSTRSRARREHDAGIESPRPLFFFFFFFAPREVGLCVFVRPSTGHAEGAAVAKALAESRKTGDVFKGLGD